MHDEKDYFTMVPPGSGFAQLPPWVFYCEQLRAPPLLALAAEDWRPFSFQSNTEFLQRAIGAEYAPEPERTQRRLLAAAVGAADELGLKIVITGTRTWGGQYEPGNGEVEYESVLVCLYSDWPQGMRWAHHPMSYIPSDARLVHSVVATYDLVGDCLRAVRSLEDLTQIEKTDISGACQFPAAA